MAEVLSAQDDEILFVDYNTPDDLPTFPEAIQDTLTAKARDKLRVFRVRSDIHARVEQQTPLKVIEPIARNVAVRRSNAGNRWILSTNSDMIFLMLNGNSLTEVVSDLPKGFYHAPRIEIPETLWESLVRNDPVSALDRVKTWGSSLHLNEIVLGIDLVRYDGPGDFQLIERKDLFDNFGFDERMLRGWHIDANIAKRLLLIHGQVGDLGAHVYGYHCDHTRRVTATHSHQRIENSWQKFVDRVYRPDAVHQSGNWGCAEDEIEEIRLNSGRSKTYIDALGAALEGPLQTPHVISYRPESFDKFDYDARHVLPFIVDLFRFYPKDANIAWLGGPSDTLSLFAAAWKSLEFKGSILVDQHRLSDDSQKDPEGLKQTTLDDMMTDAKAFVFDFSADGSNAGAVDKRRTLYAAFSRIARNERARLAQGASPRLLIAVNAIHTNVEPFVREHISAAATPFSTHLRYGAILPSPVGEQDWLSGMTPGEIGSRRDSAFQSTKGEVGLLAYGPYKYLEPGRYRFALVLAGRPPKEWAADKPFLLVTVLIDQHLIAFHRVDCAELISGKAEFYFELSEEMLCKVADGRVEAQLRLLAPVEIEISKLTVEEVAGGGSAETIERKDDRQPVHEWAPILFVGPAGTPEAGGTVALPRQEGCVAYGPYLPVPAGSYELVITLKLLDKIAANVHMGTVSVHGGANDLGSIDISGTEIAHGPLRLPFTITTDPTRSDVIVEIRILSTGAAAFQIQSAIVRKLGA